MAGYLHNNTYIAWWGVFYLGFGILLCRRIKNGWVYNQNVYEEVQHCIDHLYVNELSAGFGSIEVCSYMCVTAHEMGGWGWAFDRKRADGVHIALER